MKDFYYHNPEQPDFVCSPFDRTPVGSFLPKEELPPGHALEFSEKKYDADLKDYTVRVASSLSKASVGWESLDYLHPCTCENINGWTAKQLLETVQDLEPGDMIFDHCALLATKQFTAAKLEVKKQYVITK